MSCPLHNTRIVVVGRNEAEARAVANEIANNAFHNVAFFAGTFDEVQALLDRNPEDDRPYPCPRGQSKTKMT